MPDTTVKYFHNGMTGAPTLNGAAGSLIAILDACLVDGFGLKSVDSAVISNGQATLTIAAGHSAVAGGVVTISGVTNPAALNGERKVVSVSSSQIIVSTTDITDQTATGTITVKNSPAGWTKAFSGTNLAAYRTKTPNSNAMILRIDDTGTVDARVYGAEDMTDITTFTAKFPTEIQQAGGLYWPKSNAADSTARSWIVAADHRFMFIWVGPNATYKDSHGFSACFGNTIPYAPSDAFATIITGNTSAGYAALTAGTASTGDVANISPNSTSGKFFARNNGQTVGATVSVLSTLRVQDLANVTASYPIYVGSSQAGSASTTINTGYIVQYPSSLDGGLVLSPMFTLCQGAIRSELPGVLGTPMSVNSALNTKDTVDGTGGMAGKKMLVVTCMVPGYNTRVAMPNAMGTLFIDITGPWR